MDEQKAKRRNIHKTTTHDDDDVVVEKSQPYMIPLDLTFEILSRLPAKSIARFLCVSKLWSSFTKLPYFIKTFTTHSSKRPPSLVVTFSVKQKRFVFLLPQQENPDGSYPPVYSYEITNAEDCSCAISECLQGLVLFREFVIWNQAMRRFFNLPNPKSSDGGMSYLGYDPLEGKHKVLYVSYKQSLLAWILTLGTQESWRKISNPRPFHCSKLFVAGDTRCVNGILYYKAIFGSRDESLMSFDVRSEKFKPIKYPKGNITRGYPIIPYEGRIALVYPYIVHDDKVMLYILKDEDGDEWTHAHFLLPSKRDKTQGKDYLRFHGFTVAGEFIFAQHCLSESFYILYFDPKRNSSIREALFEGVAGDNLRLRYGLDNNQNVRDLNVFPNYNESLVMSL